MSTPLKKTIIVACDRAHAFKVFTERVDVWWPRSHRRFDASTLSFEPKVGGQLFEQATGTDERAVFGEVLCWEPPTRLCYSWNPGGGVGPTHVEVSFVEDNEQTRVDITHSEGDSQLGDNWRTRVKRFGSAWDEVLPALQHYIANKDRGDR